MHQCVNLSDTYKCLLNVPGITLEAGGCKDYKIWCLFLEGIQSCPKDCLTRSLIVLQYENSQQRCVQSDRVKRRMWLCLGASDELLIILKLHSSQTCPFVAEILPSLKRILLLLQGFYCRFETQEMEILLVFEIVKNGVFLHQRLCPLS